LAGHLSPASPTYFQTACPGGDERVATSGTEIMKSESEPGFDPESAISPPQSLHLHGWTDRAVVGVALAAFAAGVGQFGLVAALGDVARAFGRVAPGATIADQVGLSGTELGIGLAVIRLASLGSLPFIGLADRYGRRAMMLGTLALGLALTVVSAASPGYWWFVVIFACGRPMLSSTNALAQVAGAEPDRLSWSSVCCSPDRSGLWGRGRSHRGDPQPGFRGARGSGARSH
jgi:hypothetical protein